MIWKDRLSRIIFFGVLFFNYNSYAQLPNYLELRDPEILGNYISSGGKVWNKNTQELILSEEFETHLGFGIAYFSDGSNTYLIDLIDGELITTIPDNNYKYNSINSYLWNYNNQEFSAYSESGELIISIENLIAEHIFPYQDKIRYIRNNALYSFDFLDSTEELLVNFSGSFSTWFFDGEYFLTAQNSIKRLYQKNGTFIKINDIPSFQILGGTGQYWFGKTWNNIKIYNVNNDDIIEYSATSSLADVIVAETSIAILKYGLATFSIIDLLNNATISEHEGSGPYLESYDADMAGNWTTANNSGVVNYGNLSSLPPVKLNLGKIRCIFGDMNGRLAIATSSGQVILYELINEEIVQIDTYNLDSDKVKLSEDGEYIAIKGNATDAQYSVEDQSIYVYETSTQTLVKKWYYNYFNESGKHLFDFDFSRNASKVIQRTGEWSGTSWSYANYLSNTFSDESITLNSDNIDNITFSPESNIATTTNSDTYFSKIYESGALTNAFDKKIVGWINNSLFVANEVNSTTSKIFSIDGVEDATFNIPLGYEIKSMTKISNYEFYINNTTVIDIENGTVLFSLDNNYPSVPVGQDHIVYIKDNSFEIIKWRSTLSTGDIDGIDSIIKIYPNPTSNFINIDVPSFEKANVIDMFGKLILKSNDPYIDLTELSTGIYIISINEGKFLIRVIKK